MGLRASAVSPRSKLPDTRRQVQLSLATARNHRATPSRAQSCNLFLFPSPASIFSSSEAGHRFCSMHSNER
jgi:hypothetical protein